MTTKRIRAFLEYYAKAAKGVPAGKDAEEALRDLEVIEQAAKALSDSGDVDHVDAVISQEAMCRHDAALGLMASIAKEAP